MNTPLQTVVVAPNDSETLVLRIAGSGGVPEVRRGTRRRWITLPDISPHSCGTTQARSVPHGRHLLQNETNSQNSTTDSSSVANSTTSSSLVSRLLAEPSPSAYGLFQPSPRQIIDLPIANNTQPVAAAPAPAPPADGTNSTDGGVVVNNQPSQQPIWYVCAPPGSPCAGNNLVAGHHRLNLTPPKRRRRPLCSRSTPPSPSSTQPPSSLTAPPHQCSPLLLISKAPFRQPCRRPRPNPPAVALRHSVPLHPPRLPQNRHPATQA